MRRQRGGWMICILTLAVGLTLAGCQSKQPYQNIVEQTPYLGFPQGPDHVWQIDMAGLRGREDFQTLRQNWESLPTFGAFLKGLREQTGFDPLQQIDILCIARKGPMDPRNPLLHTMIIARGRFENMPQVLEKLPAFLGSEYLVAPPPFRQGEVAGIKSYQTTGQSQYNEKLVLDLNIGLPSNELMTMGFSPQEHGAVLEVIGGAQPGLQKDKVWLDKLRLVNTGANLWGAGNLNFQGNNAPQRAFGQPLPLADPLSNVREYYFFASGSSDVRFEAGLISDSIDHATQLSDALKEFLGMVKGFAGMLATQAPTIASLPEKIIVLTDMQVSKISFGLTAAELRALQAEATKLEQMPNPATLPNPGSSPPGQPE